MRALRDVLEGADRRGEPVALLTTARTAVPEGTAPHLAPAREVLSQTTQILPQAWPTDRALTAKELISLNLKDIGSTVWISDGVDGEGSGDLATALSRLGPLTVIDAGTMTSSVAFTVAVSHP